MKNFLCLILLTACFESNAADHSYFVLGPDPDIPGANRVVHLPNGKGHWAIGTDVDGRVHAHAADGTRILRDLDGIEYTTLAFQKNAAGSTPQDQLADWYKLPPLRLGLAGDLRKMERPGVQIKGLDLEYTLPEFKLDPSKLKLIVIEEKSEEPVVGTAVPAEEAEESASAEGGDAAAAEKDTSKES